MSESARTPRSAVHDRGYRRWEGEAKSRAVRFAPIALTGIRQLLRPRGSVLRNLFQYGLYGVAMIPFLAFATMIYLQKSIALASLAGDQFDASRAEFYPSFFEIELGFVLLFSLVTGAGLIAADMRANALEVYFSRPVTLLDYLLGKLAVVSFFLASITLIPALLLWLIDFVLTSEAGYLSKVAPQLGRIVIFSTLLIVVHAFTVLAISSMARKTWVAAVAWGGFMLLAGFAGETLGEILGDPRWQLISPPEAAVAFGRILFDYAPLWRPAPEAWQAGGICLLYAVLAAVVLVIRVRAVDVVKG